MPSTKAKLLSSTGTAARPEYRGVIYGEHSTTEIQRDADGGFHVRQHTPVSDHLLKKLAHQRSSRTRVAPLGDSHGAWSKMGELPLSFLTNRVPPDAWEDEKAIARVLEEYKAFKAIDGRV